MANLGSTGVVVVVQLLSRVPLFVTAWTVARQASLAFTISGPLPKLMSIELVMPSNHLIPFSTLEHFCVHRRATCTAFLPEALTEDCNGLSTLPAVIRIIAGGWKCRSLSALCLQTLGT